MFIMGYTHKVASHITYVINVMISPPRYFIWVYTKQINKPTH